MTEIFDTLSIGVNAKFYNFCDSGCGFIRQYDGARYWAIKQGENYHAVSEEDIFDYLNEKSKEIWMFNLDEIKKYNCQHFKSAVGHQIYFWFAPEMIGNRLYLTAHASLVKQIRDKDV